MIQDRAFEPDSVNHVTLRGTIRRKYRKGDQWLVLAMVTSPPNGKRDVPSIFWYGDDIDMVDKAFQIGDHVEVEARIATSAKYHTETLIGLDINETQRELEVKFGVNNEGRYMEDCNEVCLKGNILHVYVPDGSNNTIAIVTIRTTVDNRLAFPQIACFERQKEKVLEAKSGDEICIIGHIQTRTKRNEDHTQEFFQSTVAHYVQITDKH